jgi:hypothetical protein
MKMSLATVVMLNNHYLSIYLEVCLRNHIWWGLQSLLVLTLKNPHIISLQQGRLKVQLCIISRFLVHSRHIQFFYILCTIKLLNIAHIIAYYLEIPYIFIDVMLTLHWSPTLSLRASSFVMSILWIQFVYTITFLQIFCLKSWQNCMWIGSLWFSIAPL